MQIGMIGSIAAFVSILSAIVMGMVSDMSGQPKNVLYICSVGAAFGVFSLRLSFSFAPILASVLLFYFFTAPMSSICDRILMDNISKIPESYTYFRLGGSLGYCLGASGIGAVMTNIDQMLNFYIFVIMILPCIALIRAMPKPFGSNALREKPVFSDFTDIFKEKNTSVIYGSLLAWGITDTVFITFFALHFKKYGLDTERLGFCIAASMVGEMLGFIIAPAMLGKLHQRVILKIAFVCQAVRGLSAAYVFPVPLLLMGQTVGGMGFSLTWGTVTYMINATYKDRVKSIVHSFKTLVNSGLAQVIGFPLCGFIYENFDSKYIYLTATVISILFAAVLSVGIVNRHVT
jgi:PPP family 3-phenylpropionic acid transporter